MEKCNNDWTKDFTSIIDFESDIAEYDGCEQNINDKDMLDFRTQMDDLHFYEKTEWNRCEDLIYVSNEEALWQTIVGEIKTPLGVLSNSIGQSSYGCNIWSYIGENLDSLTISEIEYDVIETCIKYPEVNNVISVDTYTAENALLIEITIDSIYGTFDGTLRIPNSHISKRNWKKA